MKKIIIASLLTIGSLVGMTTSSFALGEGFSIGLSGSNAGFYGVGRESSDNGSNTGSRIVEESGAFGAEMVSVLAEFDAGPISFGVDYVVGEIETPENINRQSTGDACDGSGGPNAERTCGSGNTDATNRASATFQNHTTVYAIVPVLWGTYVKAGMIYTDIKTTEIMATGAAYPNVDTTGITAGIGYQHEMDNGLSIRIEATAADYDDVSASSSNRDSGETVAKKVEMKDMMSARGTISIVKSF